jgi:hypothetical protein
VNAEGAGVGISEPIPSAWSRKIGNFSVTQGENRPFLKIMHADRNRGYRRFNMHGSGDIVYSRHFDGWIIVFYSHNYISCRTRKCSQTHLVFIYVIHFSFRWESDELYQYFHTWFDEILRPHSIPVVDHRLSLNISCQYSNRVRCIHYNLCICFSRMYSVD